MVIRKEMAKDYGEVYSLVKKAFETPRENFMACRLAGMSPPPTAQSGTQKNLGSAARSNKRGRQCAPDSVHP